MPARWKKQNRNSQKSNKKAPHKESSLLNQVIVSEVFKFFLILSILRNIITRANFSRLRKANSKQPAELEHDCYRHCEVKANKHVTGSAFKTLVSLHMSNQQYKNNIGKCKYETAKPHEIVKLFADVCAIFENTTPLYSKTCGIIAPITIQWTRITVFVFGPLTPILWYYAPGLGLQRTFGTFLYFTKGTPPE